MQSYKLKIISYKLLLVFFTYNSSFITHLSFAQQTKKEVRINNLLHTNSALKTRKPNAVNATTCDTLTTITRKDTLALYSVTSTSAALNGGYVTGNNHYGDSAIATFIPKDTVIASGSAQIIGVKAVFYQYGTMGTKGTQTITLNIFAGDTLHGPTTTTTSITTGTVVTTATITAPPIATATASLAAISAVAPVSNAVDSAVIPILSSNYQIPYIFSFASPVTVPDTGFFISLTLPTTAGDTTALLCTRNNASKTNYAWDYGIHGWRAYSNATDWGLYTSLTLFPIVCYQPAGIDELRVQNLEFRIWPNPTSSILNVECRIQNEKAEVQIMDVLGNVLIHKSEIVNQKCTLDVSGLPAGVYFITITNSNNTRLTKKLVIN